MWNKGQSKDYKRCMIIPHVFIKCLLYAKSVPDSRKQSKQDIISNLNEIMI